MTQPIVVLALAASGLAGLIVLTLGGLRGWRGWLELERLRISGGGASLREPGPPSPAARIELADLKERIRKLEAIAAGIDL